MELIELIARAPWREAVTYRDTWPHEYVLLQKDDQHELLEAVCQALARRRRCPVSIFRDAQCVPVHRRLQVLADDAAPIRWTGMMRKCSIGPLSIGTAATSSSRTAIAG